MRFQDWDVLAFPQDSPAPVQEFRTSCYTVAQDIGRMAILNTFVPSLPQGKPFQISIHRWTKPDFSADLVLHGCDGPSAAVWGIRVAIEGETVLSETFSPEYGWPQVLGSPKEDNRNPAKRLIWPAFNETILHHRTLNVADEYSRIKVFITEGFNTGRGRNVRYHPKINVACFSFIHAPLSFLESCNIAWPNRLLSCIAEPVTLDDEPPKTDCGSPTLNSLAVPMCEPRYPSSPEDGEIVFRNTHSSELPLSCSVNLSSSAGPYSTGDLPHIGGQSALINDTPIAGHHYMRSHAPDARIPRLYMGSDGKLDRHLSDGVFHINEAHGSESAIETTATCVAMAQIAPPNIVEASSMHQSSCLGGLTSMKRARQLGTTIGTAGTTIASPESSPQTAATVPRKTEKKKRRILDDSDEDYMESKAGRTSRRRRG